MNLVNNWRSIKKLYSSELVFGVIMAVFAVILNYLEFQYFLGHMDEKIYSALLAIIFTATGIWIGAKIVKTKTRENPSSPKLNELKANDFELNDREFEVLQLIAQGHSNREIANQLFLALPTVKTHASNLYLKLEVRSRTQAVHKARSLDLI